MAYGSILMFRSGQKLTFNVAKQQTKVTLKLLDKLYCKCGNGNMAIMDIMQP